jgi:hypothetical protein
MRLCFCDTEGCGLHSPTVLIQTAFDNGPIELHDVWLRPIHETLALIEKIAGSAVVGFYLAKCYTLFSLGDPDWVPARLLARPSRPKFDRLAAQEVVMAVVKQK